LAVVNIAGRAAARFALYNGPAMHTPATVEASGAVTAQSAPIRTDAQLLVANRHFYDSFWSGARLVQAQRFNTWPLVSSILPSSRRQLEIAPGLRPRLPLADTQFVDISAPALNTLRARGASVMAAQIGSLPFSGGAFDLVCALDIVEHVDDDDAALSEIARVAAPGATVLLSAPLHAARWTEFDNFVGHRRRYEPEELHAKLTHHGLSVQRSAVYGMQPKSSRILDWGIWWLTHHRERAMWWYNQFMPLSVRFQKKLDLAPGMQNATGIDELLLVCCKDIRQ
jgi:SAM-dependent methyltransferase